MPDVTPITVGIATMDRPTGLGRCLDALLAGSVPPAEVVVVDQGAGGAAEGVVRGFAASTVPVVLVRQERRGLAASRNAAAAHARSRIVAVTDDDCVPDRGWIAALAGAFGAADPPDALCGRVLPLGPETPGTFAVSSRTSEMAAEYARCEVPWRVGTGANFAADRAWLARVGWYDERLGVGSPGRAAEDMDVLHRLLRAGARVRYEPGAVVYHERQTAASRLATRESYGYGVGAMCGLWLRRRDAFALTMLADYLAMQLRGIGRGVRSRDAAHVRGRLLSLRGVAGGLAYGLRLDGPPALAAARLSHIASEEGGRDGR